MGITTLQYIRRIVVPTNIISRNIVAILEGELARIFNDTCLNNSYIIKVTKFINKDNLVFEMNDECNITTVCKFEAQALQYAPGEFIQGEVVFNTASIFCRVTRSANVLINVSNHTIFKGIAIKEKLPLMVQFVKYVCGRMIINANIVTDIPLFNTMYVYDLSAKPILPLDRDDKFVPLDKSKKEIYDLFYMRSKKKLGKPKIEKLDTSKGTFIFDSVKDDEMYGINTPVTTATVVKLPYVEMMHVLKRDYNIYVLFINDLELSEDILLLYSNLSE